ncbi:MAG TPA: DUF2892 domain-containing protein [Solirubrobacterales bacterium]|nr:DUF2892 domain-containing protein [Solirubrobacterales bacterium]
MHRSHRDVNLGLFVIGGGPGAAVAIFSVMPMASGITGICPLGPLFGVDFRGRERSCAS